MHRCLVFVVALCLAAVLGAPSVAPAQPVMVWKAGTATAGGNPLNDTMEIFAKQIAERSRGRIKVDVHIANALAKGEAAHLEGVQLGTIDVAAIGSAPVGGMFDLLVPCEGAHVVGTLPAVHDDLQVVGVSNDRRLMAGAVGRHRIAVRVELDERGLPDGRRDHAVGFIGKCRQGKERLVGER